MAQKVSNPRPPKNAIKPPAPPNPPSLGTSDITSETAKPMNIKTPPGEFEYIGDDGGRFIFQRRSDKLVITIDKPRGIVLQSSTPAMSVLLTVRGNKLNDEVLAIVRK